MSLSANAVEFCRIYRGVRLRDVAMLWTRRLMLHRAKLEKMAKLPTQPSQSSSGVEPRLVISLSTIPSRIHKIRPVLHSLLDQDLPAAAISLAIPHFSRREQRPYVIPDYLTSISNVSILRCDDWGPATKLIPALMTATDPSMLLLIVDDDVIYPPDFVRTFLHWHKQHPDAALGYRGWSLPESLRWAETETRYATAQTEPLEVDVVTGAWGVLVQPRFFDEQLLNYRGSSQEAFYVDDIWINGHLARRGVPRLLIPARLPPMSTLIGRTNGLIFGENRDGKNNDTVIRDFAQYWNCSVTKNAGAAT